MNDDELSVGEFIADKKKGDVWHAFGFRWEHHGEFGYDLDWREGGQR